MKYEEIKKFDLKIFLQSDSAHKPPEVKNSRATVTKLPISDEVLISEKDI